MLKTPDLPPQLQAIADPPAQLFAKGTLNELIHQPMVAIVGSRKVSPYGRAVTQQLASDLAEQGIVIVSGLAYGVDSVAHEAALAAGGKTIAVLPSSLEAIYPSSHRQLASRIVEGGGALISEYPRGSRVFKTNFIARNRLIAGLADGTLVTEAALKSGSLHTARFALENGKDVMAVPGNITSPTSEGANNLLKVGAHLVTSAVDVCNILGIQKSVENAQLPLGDTPAEQIILELIQQGTTEGTELHAASNLPIEEYNHTITMLEISGKIRSLGGNCWSL